jgi:hypothetical protein
MGINAVGIEQCELNSALELMRYVKKHYKLNRDFQWELFIRLWNARGKMNLL